MVTVIGVGSQSFYGDNLLVVAGLIMTTGGVKAINCGIVVSEFVLPVTILRSLSGKYSWESMNPLILPAMG